MNIAKKLRQEQFSEAFLRSFAAPLGLNPSKLEVDNDSIDIKLTGKDYPGRFSCPEIHIQLKSTTPKFTDEIFFHYQLKKKNYNDLKNEAVVFPRYLFLFLIPDDTNLWLVEKENSLELHYIGLWYSLKGLPEIASKSKIIKIPRRNIISRTVLSEMMNSASNLEVYNEQSIIK